MTSDVGVGRDSVEAVGLKSRAARADAVRVLVESAELTDAMLCKGYDDMSTLLERVARNQVAILRALAAMVAW